MQLRYYLISLFLPLAAGAAFAVSPNDDLALLDTLERGNWQLRATGGDWNPSVLMPRRWAYQSTWPTKTCLAYGACVKCRASSAPC